METIKIKGQTGESSVLLGETLHNAAKYAPTRKTIIITDTHVWNAYHDAFPPGKVIKIGTGESIKTLDTVETIYGELLAMEADRSTFILGIGGGIVCDIAGFVASTYMRGLRFGFVASTLLSQVDASVGGKNGINFRGYKNMVGIFNQPEFVICDPALLKSLPEREIRCGFGEIVKHALIADMDLFTFLEDNFEMALKLDSAVIEKLIRDSIIIKSSIVNQDETEKGVRRKLNFGHTFGHAFEKITGITHGEAVSAGMVVAADLSERRGRLCKKDVQRIKSLLQRLNLPTSVSADKAAVLDALRRDKKRGGDSIHFVFLNAIGNAVVDEMPFQDLAMEFSRLGP
jgi:3-dehydroquinate synthase